MKELYTFYTGHSRTWRTGLLGLLLLGLSGFWQPVWGQVASNYTFSTVTGETYTPITGGSRLRVVSGTAVMDSEVFAGDSTISNGTGIGFPIGFTFAYNGADYTRFAVNVNGHIRLGTGTSYTVAGVSNPISNTSVDANQSISPGSHDMIVGRYLTGTWTTSANTITVTGGNISPDLIGKRIFGTQFPAGTTVVGISGSTLTLSANPTVAAATANRFTVEGELRYQLIGSAPNRVLVVQWVGSSRWVTSSAATFDELNFQIRLNETSNRIDFVYGTFNSLATAARNIQLGIRGSSNTDFSNRTTTTNWASTTAGSSNTSTVSYSATVFPAPGLRFSYSPASCLAPSGLSFNSLTTTSATASWTASPSASGGYNVRFRATGAPSWIDFPGNPVSGTSAVLTGLSAATTYDVQVQSICAGPSTSAYTFSATFVTPCNALSIFPWSENFNSASSSALLNCWSGALVSGTTPWQTHAGSTDNDGVPSGAGGTGRFAGKAWNNSVALLSSPPLDMATGFGSAQARLRVKVYRNNSNASGDSITFFVNNTNSLTGAIRLLMVPSLRTATAPATAYADAITSQSTNGWYDFTAIIPVSMNTATTYVIAQGTTASGGSSYGIGFDDIVVETAPSCLPPSGLSVSSITTTTANVSWNSVASATGGYNVQFRVTGSPSWTDFPGNPVSGTSASLTGLSVGTAYDVQVQSICAGPSTSAYTVSATFVTPCNAVSTFPWSENFNSASSNALLSCWSGALVSGTTPWQTHAGSTDNDGVPSGAGGTGRFAGKAWNNSVALLSSPPLDMTTGFGSAQARLRVKVYRNDSNASSDSITFFVNNTNSLTGAIRLLMVPSLRTATAPATAYADAITSQSTNGWYDFTATIPVSMNTATTYVIAQGTTASGSSSYGIGFDDIVVEAVPAGCAGTPTGGTTLSSASTVCNGGSSNFTLSGQSIGLNLTYQWQSSANNVDYTNISGAIAESYTGPVTTSAKWFRCLITCTTSSQSATSTPVEVNVTVPVYATLPFFEGFESWTDGCGGTTALPSANWANLPATGNNSWRRHDQGASAGWSSNFGLYSPVAVSSSFSARFHTYDAAGAAGVLDLYINLSTPGTKQLTFNYINPAGTDSLEVLLSDNGGLSFSRVGAALTGTGWLAFNFNLSGTSATSVLRFRAVGGGTSDIGLDNVQIAAATTWTGTSWTNGTPDINTAAIIDANYPAAQPSFSARSLQVNAADTLTIADGKSVTVALSVLVSANGMIRVLPGGAFVQQAAGTFAAGTTASFQVQQQGWSGLNRYNLWSTPISSTLAISPLFEGTVYRFNESAYQWQVATGNMVVGTGYGAVGSNLKTFSGRFPNNGNISVPVTRSWTGAPSEQGWNLIGNPYPSPISASDFAAANSALLELQSFYYWDDDATGGTGYTSSDYAVWNVATGTGIAGGAGRTPTGPIAVGQAFFIKASAAGNVQFTNAMRTANPALFLRETNVQRAHLRLSSANGLRNETAITFSSGASEGFDQIYDAPKRIGNANIAFYSLADETPCAIQGLPLVSQERIVRLGMNAAVAGEYTIALTAGNLDESLAPYLYDKQLNRWHDLRTGAYSFTTGAVSASERFELRFQVERVSGVETGVSADFYVYAADRKAVTRFKNVPYQQATVAVLNTLGQVVVPARVIGTTEPYTVDLSAMPAGCYLIRVQTPAGNATKKVFID